MSSPLQVKRCSGGKTLLRAFNQRRQFRSCAYRAGKWAWAIVGIGIAMSMFMHINIREV